MTKKELTECMLELSEMIIDFKKEDIYLQLKLRGYPSKPLSISVFIQDDSNTKNVTVMYDYQYNTLKNFISAIYDKKNEMLKNRESKEERIKKLEKELEELKNENN